MSPALSLGETNELSLPLAAPAGARELLLLRFETVSLPRYLEGLRFAYRLATYPDATLGVLVPGLAERHPPSPGQKSPPLREAEIRKLIRRDLDLSQHHPLTKDDMLRWLGRRDEKVMLGERQTRLDGAEEEMLVPSWACEAVATCLEMGPVLTRERVERFGVRFADGRDGFVSKKAADEPSPEYPTPATVDRVKDVFVSLFDTAVDRIRKRYGEQSPAWLRPWPGDWVDLNFHPHERATSRRRRRTDEAKVRAAFICADEVCAAPFLARFGANDIEIAAEPDRFWKSFETRDEGRRWLRNKNIALVERNRAVTSLALIAGERCPELAASLRGDLQLSGFSHPALSQSFGIVDPLGAIFFRASAKTRSQLGAHHSPLPLAVCDRLRAWLFVCDVLLGRPLAEHDPLFLAELTTGATASGLSQRAIGEAASRLLVQYGGLTPNSRGYAGFNVIRRFTDQAILDYFDDWRRDRDGIRPGLTAVAVKEAGLGHSKIGIDLHGYSGLSDDDGRVLLKAYGGEIVAGVIWGNLGGRRGPDEARIRDAIATQRALEASRVRTSTEIASISQRLLTATTDATTSAGNLESDVARLVALQAQDNALSDRIAAQRSEVAELFNDRDRWVRLKDGQKRLTKADMRELSDNLLGTRHGTYPPVRDFFYMKEVCQLLNVEAGSVRDWCNSARPEEFSRICPWTGNAPIHRPDERTVLFAAAALDESRIANPDRWAALRRLLATWPQGRGWHPRDGAKTRLVRQLSESPIRLRRLPANDLLMNAPEDCTRVFSFLP